MTKIYCHAKNVPKLCRNSNNLFIFLKDKLNVGFFCAAMRDKFWFNFNKLTYYLILKANKFQKTLLPIVLIQLWILCFFKTEH